GGAYAELAVVPRASLVPLPDGASFAEGAGFLLTFLTAYVPLTRQVRFEEGGGVLCTAPPAAAARPPTQFRGPHRPPGWRPAARPSTSAAGTGTHRTASPPPRASCSSSGAETGSGRMSARSSRSPKSSRRTSWSSRVAVSGRSCSSHDGARHRRPGRDRLRD